MGDDWLTYREAAERIGCTAESIRFRAMRGRWPRRRGNDGRALVQLPDKPIPVARPVRTASTPPVPTELVSALKAHVETVKNENESLKAQLAGVETRLAATEVRALAEAEKAGKAIDAFAALAERLDVLAAQRTRPWWRRLAG